MKCLGKTVRPSQNQLEGHLRNISTTLFGNRPNTVEKNIFYYIKKTILYLYHTCICNNFIYYIPVHFLAQIHADCLAQFRHNRLKLSIVHMYNADMGRQTERGLLLSRFPFDSALGSKVCRQPVLFRKIVSIFMYRKPSIKFNNKRAMMVLELLT